MEGNKGGALSVVTLIEERTSPGPRRAAILDLSIVLKCSLAKRCIGI